MQGGNGRLGRQQGRIKHIHAAAEKLIHKGSYHPCGVQYGVLVILKAARSVARMLFLPERCSIYCILSHFPNILLDQSHWRSRIPGPRMSIIRAEVV